MKFKVMSDVEIHFEKFDNMCKDSLWEAVNKAGEISIKIVPVRTGKLQRSLHVTPKTPGKKRYTFGDKVDYGVYVEFGTSRMAAQPFLRPALDELKRFGMKKVMAKKSR
jgi:HK97 gp10 family phage protein